MLGSVCDGVWSSNIANVSVVGVGCPSRFTTLHGFLGTWLVTAVPGAALGAVVKRAGERDVHKACVAAATASVSP